MKKINYILVTLIIISGNIYSQQSYINYVLGKYVGTVSRSGCTSASPSPGVLYLLPSLNYNFAVREDDSSGLGMYGEPWDIQVFADSTMARYMGPGVNGRLYSNDSIYLTVFIFGSTGCYRTFNGFKLYSTVSVNELNKLENELLISPQPAADIIYIQSTQVLFKEKEPPTFYDLNGKKIKIVLQYVNSNTYKTDVSNLNAGVYFIVVQTEKGFIRKKIIVQ